MSKSPERGIEKAATGAQHSKDVADRALDTEIRPALERIIRRCAWCERIWNGDGWIREAQPVPSAWETASICIPCVEHLRAANLSH